MSLNSTEIASIRIKNQDQEIEWEESFQSRIDSRSFGAKRRGSFIVLFMEWIWVIKPKGASLLLFFLRSGSGL